MMIVEVAFLIVMAALVAIGLLCSARLDDRNPCWVRWIVLSPALVALFTSYRMLTAQYIPYVEDVVFYLSLCAMYALVYSRFTGRPWLDLRTQKWLKERT